LNESLKARRLDLLRRMVKGAKLFEAVPPVAKRWRVSSETLSRDWGRRKSWIPKIVNLQDPTIIHEILTGMREIIPNIWATYARAIKEGNTSSQIGALRTAIVAYLKIIELLQATGYIPAEPVSLKADAEDFAWEDLDEAERKTLIEGAKILIKQDRKKRSKDFQSLH